MYEKVECKFNKFWVPLVWANSVLTQARKEGRIDSEIGFRLVIEQISDFRDKCSLCFVYDWITIPLVYTQVVTLAVYMFFGACLIGRQYVDNNDDKPDFYVPFFTILQFFFYMGWLKVAEQMINPFGEDDDDYDMNWLIDRHTAVAMCLADQCHSNYPELVKDIHFNEIVSDLPYTEAAMSSRRPNFLGSTYNLERPSIVDQRLHVPSPLVDNHHQHLRHRSNTNPRQHGSGSLWSLFQGFKPNLHRGAFSGSRETLKSTTSTMMNGHAGMGPLNYAMGHDDAVHHEKEHRGRLGSDDSRNDASSFSDLPPEYVPLRRARASSTDTSEHRPLQRVINNDRERKWSFPLNLLRKKQEKELFERGVSISSMSSQEEQLSADPEFDPLITPPLPKSRFTVEAVPGDTDIDASKQSRNKQILDKHMGYMAVSRPPVLSAIEEGNTIRSMKEIISSPSSVTSLETMEESDIPIPTTIEEEGPCDDDVFQQLDNMSDQEHNSMDSIHSGTKFVNDVNGYSPLHETTMTDRLQKTGDTYEPDVHDVFMPTSSNIVSQPQSPPPDIFVTFSDDDFETYGIPTTSYATDSVISGSQESRDKYNESDAVIGQPNDKHSNNVNFF
ncbi:chloride channel [Mactra antiquata]